MGGVKLRRSGFGDLQAQADARHGDADTLAARVRAARDAYEARPCPTTHTELARAVGMLTVALDPDGVTGTARLWRRRRLAGG